MWTVDDEIRDEISALLKDKQYDKKWYERLLAVVQRAEEMIYKEANILFPNCAANFTEEEWIGIYHDQKDYADCLGVKAEIWEDAESNKKISEYFFRFRNHYARWNTEKKTLNKNNPIRWKIVCWS